MANPESSWQGYRRRRGTAEPWEKVPGAAAPGRLETYQLLMRLCELVNTGIHSWDYCVYPAQEIPPVFPGTYRHRMLRSS